MKRLSSADILLGSNRRLLGSGIIMDSKPTYAELEKRVHELEQTNTACQQRLAELHQSEDRFRRLWEQSPLGYQSLDAQGRLVEVNQSWIDTLGYIRDEVLGRSFADFLHPDWQEHFKTNFPRFKEIGEILGVEFEMVKKDGALITVSFNGKIARDDDGQFRQTHCILHDITERRQTEEALRRSEERWNAAIENSGEGAIIATEAEQLIYWNPAARAMHGFSSDQEGIGPLEEKSDTFELWTPDGTRLLTIDEWPMRRIKRGETVRKMELRLRRPDKGWERIVVYSGAMVCTPSGENLIFLSVNDLTEQRKAETALRASEEQFRYLADAMPQLVWTAQPDGQVDYYNRRHEEYLGIEKIVNGNYRWDPVLHPEDVAPTVKAWQDACQSGRMYQFEHRVHMKDGSYRWHLSRAIPIHNAEGRVIKWFGTATDISTVKQAEDELRRLNETLEQKVIERTAIAEARAAQLRSLAVELMETEERERRQFAYLLHDDLQQMLAAAKMQVGSMVETLPADPVLSGVVDLLDQSITRTRRLSHQLSPAILYHGGLIASLNWLVRQMDEQFSLKVELNVNTELLLERTPQKMFLFRAVQELLFNSIKHAGVKKAQVEVTSSENSITVNVSDQGCGFTPELKARTCNLGLGLLTIKERAGYIGGKFTIESAPGQGSRFTLTVPDAAASGEEGVAQGALMVDDTNHSRPDATISVADGIRVLFVDDHRVMRQGLINLVKNQPAIHVAGEASNGREAIEQAHKLLPDVIVMDVSMPEMDGIEATRRIKEELPQVRIIGLTMHDDEQISASMKQAGAEVTLSKTLSAAEVVKTIYGAGRCQ
jgi:PAS domain S-box-containing protein